MGYVLKQGQTAQPLTFLMVLASDHLSPATGKTVTVTISKNGGSFATPAGAVSEIGSGWYKVAGNATDSATLGPLLLHATEASCDPTDREFGVVAYDPQATSLGLSLAKGTNITGLNDIAATAIVSGGAITTASGVAQASVANIGGVSLVVPGSGSITFSNVVGTSVYAGGAVPVSGTVVLTDGSLTTAKFAAGATIPRVTLADTLTTYTGNTPQTGDAFARIGANGAGLTAVPAATFDYTAFLAAMVSGGGVAARVICIGANDSNGTTAAANFRADELAAAPTLPAVDGSGRVTVGSIATDAISAAAVSSAAVTKIGASSGGTAQTGDVFGLLNPLISAGAFTGPSLANVPKSGYILAAAGLDAVVVETGVNARQALSPILAAACGVVTGAVAGSPSTVVIKGGNVATTRISAATTADGNRTAVTLTLPS